MGIVRRWLPLALVGVGVSLSATARAQVVFSDGFESSPTSWGIFEEVVGGNTCYATGIGSVEQTTEQHHQGVGSLRVWANQPLSSQSDHVIAQQQLSTAGVTGRYRYELWSLVDPQAGDGLHEGQTGPEFSLQNTRMLPQGYRTTTGGIQYVANKWSGQGTWNVWTDNGSGTAAWAAFATQTLSPGTWYKLTLDVDYDANRYIAFSISGGSLDVSVDLSADTIVPEVKFTQEAFWATLEGENAWSACAQVFEYRVYYDDVSVQQISSVAAVPAMTGPGVIGLCACIGAGGIALSAARERRRRGR